MLFGKDYEKQINELVKKNEALVEEIAYLRKSYEAEIQLTSSLTNCLEEERTKNIALMAELDCTENPNEYIDQLKRERNRAYANGRMDAYAEMGIKNIEAHERDNILARMPDGEIVEMILGLKDVEPEETVFTKDDEIPIDDLTEV